MIQEIFSTLTEITTEVIDWFTSIFEGVIGLFYADSEMTLLGTLALIGLSVGVFYFVLRFIIDMLQFRAKG